MTPVTTAATATDTVGRCPECNTRVRQDGTEVVCEACGLVVDEHAIDHGPEWRRFDDDETNPERCYPGDRDRADRGLGSTPPWFRAQGPEHDREVDHRNQIARSGWSRKDRNRDYTTSEIRRLTAALELPDPVAEQATRAFRAWHDAENLGGQNLDRLAAAAVLYAARAAHAGVTADDVLAVARTEGGRGLRRAMHRLADAVGVAVRPPSPQARLDRLVGDSNLDVGPETHTRARTLLDDPPSGRSPTTLAAAALYLAGGGRGGRGGRWSADSEWTQAELADVADICQQSVRTAAAALHPGYGQAGDE